MPKKFYIGIKALIKQNNSILLLKCKRSNEQMYWDLPGGRIDDNETINDALLRELKEELPNIENIKIYELINIYNHPKIFENGEGLFLLFYNVTADFKDIQISEEHCDYLWVNKDNFSVIEEQAILNSEYKKMLCKLLF